MPNIYLPDQPAITYPTMRKRILLVIEALTAYRKTPRCTDKLLCREIIQRLTNCFTSYYLFADEWVQVSRALRPTEGLPKPGTIDAKYFAHYCTLRYWFRFKTKRLLVAQARTDPVAAAKLAELYPPKPMPTTRRAGSFTPRKRFHPGEYNLLMLSPDDLARCARMIGTHYHRTLPDDTSSRDTLTSVLRQLSLASGRVVCGLHVIKLSHDDYRALHHAVLEDFRLPLMQMLRKRMQAQIVVLP